jgi:hypothetical protein
MNYPEENSPDRNPKPADEDIEDRELKSLLCEWRAPEITGSLDPRILTAYRRQFHHRPWWRRWLTGSISLPVPVAAIAVLLLCATSYLAIRRATNYSVEVPPVSAPVKVVEVPVPVIQEKLVTRVVYAKARPQKAKESSAPDFLNSVDENKALAQADLTGFRPVSEIKIIVVKGRQE